MNRYILRKPFSEIDMSQTYDCSNVFSLGERSLMTSHIRVGRGSKIAPKKGRYRVGQGR